MFKDSFKYYKSRNPPPTLEKVIDIENPDNKKVKRVPVENIECLEACEIARRGLRETSTWEIFEFSDIPGLIFIKNPFTSAGQRYWITKCLKDYSREPSKLNIDAHDFLANHESWWDICTSGNDRGKNLVGKLRWATLGYHHNWDTKYYSENNKSHVPQELMELTGILAKCLGFEHFNAEAAIINFYRMNSTLAGHVDHSEVDMAAPLFSVSFGQTAIFLIGGLKQEDPANAIFLNSGDIVVMSGDSRMRYHGVPKILPTKIEPWHFEDLSGSDILVNSDDWKKASVFISEARINMNVRQVLKPGEKTLIHNT